MKSLGFKHKNPSTEINIFVGRDFVQEMMFLKM